MLWYREIGVEVVRHVVVQGDRGGGCKTSLVWHNDVFTAVVIILCFHLDSKMV